MTHVSSEIQEISPKDGLRCLLRDETSLGTPLCEDAFAQDSDLRSMVEEKAFQALSEGFLRSGPQHTFFVPETDEEQDILSSTFPRKLWKIVGSDQFKSIWWDETGTSIVIDEELFKKEVLESKAPFRIFATRSMKSLVRQLNLYGFSKLQRHVQRSASLAQFLAEEREVPIASKILYYHNPNFKRSSPHLLVKIKRRIGIKSAVPASSIDQDSSKQPSSGERQVNKHNSGLAAETNEDGLLSSSRNINALLLQISNSQITANANAPVTSEFYPISTFSDPSGQNETDPQNNFNQLPIPQMYAARSYSQADSQIGDFVRTEISTSQNHIRSTLQNTDFGRVLSASTFPSQDTDSSVTEGPLPNLQSRSNIPYQIPSVPTDASAAPFQFSTYQLSSLYEYLPNDNVPPQKE